MQSADSRAQPTRTASHPSPPSPAGREAAGERGDDLERWLCDPAGPAPSLDDLASAFGVSFDTPTSSNAGALPRRLRFTLAVLRDAFPNDGAVRRWLRMPVAERDGERPLDLLLGGHIDQLEELAIREWNRLPATITLSEG